MTFQEKNVVNEEEIKQKIDKLKETINESLGLSNIKLNELEKELQEFQLELNSSAQSNLSEQSFDFDKLLRLYKAERSLTDVLQQKIINLEKDLTEVRVSLKASKSTDDLFSQFKDFFKEEFSKISISPPNKEIESKPPAALKETVATNLQSTSIEHIISKENKAIKEERQRLQSENQDLQKELHYYKEKNENLRKELQFRNQEVQSFKKILEEREEEQEEENASAPSKSINDEFGYTLEEEFELTKEELNTLKGKLLTLEQALDEKEHSIEDYKKELTNLKRVLADKNSEIRQFKRSGLPSEEMLVDESQPEISEKNIANDETLNLREKVAELEKQLTDAQMQLQVLEHRDIDKELMDLQVLNDKLSKAVYKIEKTINIFDAAIIADAETFNRHIEVYGLLLSKLFNASGYAQVIDILLKHKGKALTKKMVMNESKTEPHIAIRVLRDLHDSKIIHFDEEMDQIIWRQ